MITARGGSERLPGKNIRMLSGKPLIAHTILAAKQLGDRISRLVLSTDAPEIADIGRQWGAEVPFLRPDDLAGSESSSIDTVLHCVAYMENKENRRYAWVLLLQPTSPLRTCADIAAALDLAETEDVTSVISVTAANDCHPQLMQTIEGGLLRPYRSGEQQSRRRRDQAPDVYRLNGAIYLTRRETLLQERSFYGQRPRAYVMPRERALDIDDELDFMIAECVHNRLLQEGEVRR